MRSRLQAANIDLSPTPTETANFLCLSKARMSVAFIIVLASCIYILFSHRFLSINDLLSHLARSWILFHLKSTPAFRQEYASNWSMLPDLALDLYSNVLGRILSLPWVGKSFVALTFALLLSGACAVHHALYRRWSVWPLAAALLLYNRVLLAGEVNFLFAVGLYLHETALWIQLREKAWAWRVAVAGVGAIVIFFAHLFPVGLLAVTLAGYEIGRALQRGAPLAELGRDLVSVALPFLAPAIAVLVWTPHSHTSFVMAYQSLGPRLTAFATPLLYRPIIEAGGFAVLLGLLGWLASKGRIRVDPRLACALLLLFLVQLAMPLKLLTATGADHRIPIAWEIFAISAVDIVAETRRTANLVIAAVLVLLVGRLAIIEARWNSDDRIYANVEKGVRRLPPGSKVALGYPPWAFTYISRPGIAAFFIPTWEIAHAGGFTQTVYAIPTQHPLVMTPAYARLANSAPPKAVWAAFDRSAACPSASSAGEYAPPPAWGRFDAFVILFPDPVCLHPIRPMALLYKSPVLAVYDNRREPAAHRDRSTRDAGAPVP